MKTLTIEIEEIDDDGVSIEFRGELTDGTFAAEVAEAIRKFAMEVVDPEDSGGEYLH